MYRALYFSLNHDAKERRKTHFMHMDLDNKSCYLDKLSYHHKIFCLYIEGVVFIILLNISRKALVDSKPTTYPIPLTLSVVVLSRCVACLIRI